MSKTQFNIPKEFELQLRYVDTLDPRSDGEIIGALSQYSAPTDSEKNIWLFWNHGIQNMPKWSQRNVCDLSRINGPSWVIRVLDSDPKSPNYALKFIESELLPNSFQAGTMDGPFVGPHQADMLRGAALWKYGGVWIDCGCIPLRKLDDLCWTELEDPSSPITVSGPGMFGTTLANHFTAARKGDQFIKVWHDYFCYLWKGKTNATNIANDPHFFKIISSIRMEDAFEAGFQWEWDAPPKVVMEYIGQIQAWNVVAKTEEPQPGGFNGPKYFEDHIGLFDALLEDWRAESMIGWKGQDLFDVVSTPLDADPSSEEYRKAYDVIWALLTQSSMQKVTRGAKLGPAHFGTLLDEWDVDEKAPKTFFDLLRYGAVHFEQVDRKTRPKKPEHVEAVIKDQLMPV